MKSVGNYTLLREIGHGSYGTVYLARNETNKKEFAVKCVPKAKLKNKKEKALFINEQEVMEKLMHPNILPLLEYIETGNNYYLVLPFCKSGDLKGFLEKHGPLGENQSVFFLMQILNAAKEMRSKKIMHRDIKPANMFLDEKQLILADLGFAKANAEETSTYLGTPITMAPEVLMSQKYGKAYNYKADLWSIGVVFYMMIYNTLPFPCASRDQIVSNIEIMTGDNLSMPPKLTSEEEKAGVKKNYPAISDECRDFLKRLVNPDPNVRMDYKDIFNHKLFLKYLDPRIFSADPEQNKIWPKILAEFKANRMDYGEVVPPMDLDQLADKKAVNDVISHMNPGKTQSDQPPHSSPAKVPATTAKPAESEQLTMGPSVSSGSASTKNAAPTKGQNPFSKNAAKEIVKEPETPKMNEWNDPNHPLCKTAQKFLLSIKKIEFFLQTAKHLRILASKELLFSEVLHITAAMLTIKAFNLVDAESDQLQKNREVVEALKKSQGVGDLLENVIRQRFTQTESLCKDLTNVTMARSPKKIRDQLENLPVDKRLDDALKKNFHELWMAHKSAVQKNAYFKLLALAVVELYRCINCDQFFVEGDFRDHSDIKEMLLDLENVAFVQPSVKYLEPL